MSTLETLFEVPVAVYRLVVALWNACIVFTQVMRSVMQEAKQEAAELMALLDDGAPMMVSPCPVTIQNVLLIGFSYRTRSRRRRCCLMTLGPRTHGKC